MVTEGKNGSNTFGEGRGTFPPIPPPNAGFGGMPARAQDIGLVAPVLVARQGGPRHRRRGATLARAASVATLSRHMHWRDRGYLSRQGKWRDQTGYSLQIKPNTG